MAPSRRQGSEGCFLISPRSRDWTEHDIGKSSPACILMIGMNILPRLRGRYSVVSAAAILNNRFPLWILSSLDSIPKTTSRWSHLKFGESIEMERELTYLRWESQPCYSHCRGMPVQSLAGKKSKRLTCPFSAARLLFQLPAIISTPSPAFNISRKECPGSCRGEHCYLNFN